MFGILACPIRVATAPDPWDIFERETLAPLLELSLLVTLGVLAVLLVGTLVLGLFTTVTSAERRMCGTVPLSGAVAAFLFLLSRARHLGEWWVTDTALHAALLPLVGVSSALGLMVITRPWFFPAEH